ncbi:hypothetical protein CspHIS471_0303450 [Cutaneotrichosporon sp. HIS471]|nr:hypothetical protein CspHIS471_0303450 [Cutaneotrichosporon sp. HIS471]
MLYKAFKERLEANLVREGLSIDVIATKSCFNQLGSRMQFQISNALVAAQDPAWDDAHPRTRMSHMTNAVKKGWTPSHLLFAVADRAATESEDEVHKIAQRMGVASTTVYTAFKKRLEANLAKKGLDIDALATKPCLNQLGSRMQANIYKALMSTQDPAWDHARSVNHISPVTDALKKGWTPSHLLFVIADRAARVAEEEAQKIAEGTVDAAAAAVPRMATPLSAVTGSRAAGVPATAAALPIGAAARATAAPATASAFPIRAVARATAVPAAAAALATATIPVQTVTPATVTGLMGPALPVNAAALIGALRHSIAAVEVAVDRLETMAAPFQNQPQKPGSIHDAASDAHATFMEPSSMIDARLKAAFRAANYAASGGHGYATETVLGEIQRFSDQRLASSLIEGAQAAEKRLAASLVDAELQSCIRLQAALAASQNVVAGRVEVGIRHAEAAAEQRLAAAVLKAKEDTRRQLQEEIIKPMEEERRLVTQRMEGIMEGALADAERRSEWALRQSREDADERMAANLDEAARAADAKVVAALEATTAADARVVEALKKAEQIAVQHNSEIKELKTTIANHQADLAKARGTYATSINTMRKHFALESDKLRADLIKERQELETMRSSCQRKLAEMSAQVGQDGNTCIICLDDPADQMPFRCQHVVMCFDCSERVVQDSGHCPFCVDKNPRPKAQWRVFLAV